MVVQLGVKKRVRQPVDASHRAPRGGGIVGASQMCPIDGLEGWLLAHCMCSIGDRHSSPQHQAMLHSQRYVQQEAPTEYFTVIVQEQESHLIYMQTGPYRTYKLGFE